MNILKYILASVAIFIMCRCSTPPTEDKSLTVSIEPLRYVVMQIAGNDFDVHVLVPPGASPETYEPTPTQLREVAQSDAFIAVGLLDYERTITRSIESNMPNVKIIRVCEQMPLRNEDHADHASEPTAGESLSHHHQGVDPHIWLSTSRLKIIANHIYSYLAERYPDSTKYRTHYEAFCARTDSLERSLREMLGRGEHSFMIFHPALSYFAEDYGIKQIPLEFEGKEPSATYLASLMATADTSHVSKILYQSQFSRTTVDAVAHELHLQAVEIDPLATDVLSELKKIGHLISE